MYLMNIVADKSSSSSTMDSGSTSDRLLDNVDKDMLSEEAATIAPASSTLHSLEGKSVDTETLEAQKTDSTVDQLKAEFKEVNSKSTEDNATDKEQDCDKKSEPDFQSSSSDEKEPSSAVEIESSNDEKNKLSSNSADLNLTDDLAVDMKHLASDSIDSEITNDSMSHEDGTRITQTEPSSLETSNAVLSTSSKPSLVEGTAVDAKQKTTEQNEPNSLSKEEELSSMDVGATGSEENSNMSDTQESKSGFDSADSTNDVDSFITQEAVQMAIKLMDEEEGGDKKNDNLSSSNNVASSPHEESVIGIHTDCSSTSKTERPRKVIIEEFTDSDMKKVEQNVSDVESTRDVACNPENMCPQNKNKLDDDKNTEIDPAVVINGTEEKIGNLKSIEDDKVDKVNINSTAAINKAVEQVGYLESIADSKVEKIDIKSTASINKEVEKMEYLESIADVEKINTESAVIEIKDDLLKDKTKQECVDITLEEKNESKQQLDSIMTIESHDQVSVTNEFAKKREESVCSNKTEIQEISVSDISNENKPQLKPLEKIQCEVTHLDSNKSSIPAESTSKMDMADKDLPDKNSKGELVTNSEIYRPSGVKSDERLQNSNQEFPEIDNSCNLSKKENANLVAEDTDSELMEVDEQILTEKESLVPNTQSLSTPVKNENESQYKLDSLTKINNMSTSNDKIENTPEEKNTTTEINPTASKSSDSACRKNLDSEAPDLIEPDQADIADPSSSDLVACMRSALAKNEEFRKNLSSEYKDLKDEMIEESSDIELICLDDDEEVVQIKRPPEAKLCVNPNCMSGVDLQKPANFVLTYFKLKKAKNQLVCAECFNVVCKHHQVRQNE